MNTKTCTKCKETKQETEFYLHSRYDMFRRKATCITCERAYHKNRCIMLKKLGVTKQSEISEKCNCCGSKSYKIINSMCEACNTLHISINLVNKDQAYMLWI